MLSSAMVRLHRKHGGIVPALAAWFIILSFNVSRAAFWTVVNLVTHTEASRVRRSHFLKLVRNLHLVWPTSGKVTS